MDCQTVRTEVHVEPNDAAIRAHLGACPRCAAYAERFARLDHVVRAELVVSAPPVLTQELRSLPLASDPQPTRLDAALRDELLVAVPAALSERLRSLALDPDRVKSRADAAIRDALVLEAPADLTARLQALIPKPVPMVAAQSAPVAERPRRWVVASVYFVTAALLMLSLLYAGQIYGLVIAQFGLEGWLQQIAALPGQLLQQLYATVPQSRIVVGTLVWLQQPLQWLLIALLLWAVLDMSQRQKQRSQQYV